WLKVTFESTRTSHSYALLKMHRCNVSSQNVSAKVSHQIQSIPKNQPDQRASADHASLSSIFNCQKTDETNRPGNADHRKTLKAAPRVSRKTKQRTNRPPAQQQRRRRCC